MHKALHEDVNRFWVGRDWLDEEALLFERNEGNWEYFNASLEGMMQLCFLLMMYEALVGSFKIINIYIVIKNKSCL